MSNQDETHAEDPEEKSEDLELDDDAADKVRGGDTAPKETIHLDFGKVEVEYQQQKPD